MGAAGAAASVARGAPGTGAHGAAALGHGDGCASTGVCKHRGVHTQVHTRDGHGGRCTSVHGYRCTRWSARVHVHGAGCTDTELLGRAGTRTRRYTQTEVHTHVGTRTRRYMDTQVHTHSAVPPHPSPCPPARPPPAGDAAQRPAPPAPSQPRAASTQVAPTGAQCTGTPSPSIQLGQQCGPPILEAVSGSPGSPPTKSLCVGGALCWSWAQQVALKCNQRFRAAVHETP